MFIGVDIGSTNSKICLLNLHSHILELASTPTGLSGREAYNFLLSVLQSKGYKLDDAVIVSTGYGREIVAESFKKITEISCHTKGAEFIFSSKDFVLIDVGGQDTKVVLVTSGKVVDFAMNDKCSAGTGRFLDVMAKIFNTSVGELVELASKSTKSDIQISSLCTVFAESEVISLIGKAVAKQDIAYAIVDSIVKKVASQASKIDLTCRNVYLSGGLCSCSYFVDMLSAVLKVSVTSNPNAIYAGCIGAALFAKELSEKHA